MDFYKELSYELSELFKFKYILYHCLIILLSLYLIMNKPDEMNNGIFYWLLSLFIIIYYYILCFFYIQYRSC